MPIRPELRPLYRRDTGWPEVRALVRARAAGQLELPLGRAA